MPNKHKCHTIWEVIQELDAWMQHFVSWSSPEPNQHGVTTPIGVQEASLRRAKLLEQARNALAEEFGEPED
uniref:Uncharacterized protein n=1 Tax=viral metagenome TaxID=1070528 RepID=A0A6H2A378_9ZZZZ